ncbi:MAG: sulfatase [Planctomycetota bacterium]|nr:sulfatase [Planctomycetota bacterium]
MLTACEGRQLGGNVPVSVATGPAPLIVIVVDTLRYDHVTPERMPNVMKLAEDGVSFSRAFSHAPMTLPAHTALFSSTYPGQNGVKVNGTPVPGDLPLVSKWLANQGYQTAAVASLATLWSSQPQQSLDQGFDTFTHVFRDYSHGPKTTERIGEVMEGLTDQPLFLFAHFADPHEPYRDFESTEPQLQLKVNGLVLEELTTSHSPHFQAKCELQEGDHEVSLISDGDFVMRSLYVHDSASGARIPLVLTEGKRLSTLQAVRGTFHLDKPATVDIESWVNDHPSQAEAKLRYRAEVTVADKAVGKLLRDLQSMGIYDQSLIVFTSDHGEAFGEHAWNGHSESLFDELLHVPLIVKPPAGQGDLRIRLGQSAQALIRHVDVVPTVLDILELPVMPGMVGVSLLDPQRGDLPLLAETHQPEASQDQLCLRNRAHKLLYFPETDSFQLFDLRADPLETQDVFTAKGHQFSVWQEELRERAEQAHQVRELPQPRQKSDLIESLGY